MMESLVSVYFITHTSSIWFLTKMLLDICFDTLTPVAMEMIQFHRTMTGDQQLDNRKYKQRVGSTHEGHAIVAPYCPHLRLVLYNDHYRDVISEFVGMCEEAGLAKSMIIQCKSGFSQIEALRQQFFHPKRLHELHKTLGKFDWPIAFQLESLLHNGLLHTGDLDELLPRIRELIDKCKKSSSFVGELLRRYNEALQVRSPRESPMHCFQSVQKKFEFTPPDKSFRCYHVTFTPTRMILEGPYPSQSNRVIRQYQGFEDHFIRVDFRDEDRLQYRWEREVDGTPFLVDRVGNLLKGGFLLAGRSFEFLAYSSSALREHAVWFMNPFFHSDRDCTINAALIRDSLGNFQGTPLLQCPSKYAARLAQAFTATDPSVYIRKSEWMEVPDLGEEPYLFTDGVGAISKALGDKIWAELCETKHNPENLIQPSAVTIFFYLFKIIH
jgi:RNA-dependent RNA polymerase